LLGIKLEVCPESAGLWDDAAGWDLSPQCQRRVYGQDHGKVCWLGTPVGGDYMKIRFASLLTAGMLLAGAVMNSTSAVAQTMPKVGDMAPDFSMKYFTGNELKDVKLSDFRGKKNVVLAFYVFAFTGG
jgi:hypothetical protein